MPHALEGRPGGFGLLPQQGQLLCDCPRLAGPPLVGALRPPPARAWRGTSLLGGSSPTRRRRAVLRPLQPGASAGSGPWVRAAPCGSGGTVVRAGAGTRASVRSHAPPGGCRRPPSRWGALWAPRSPGGPARLPPSFALSPRPPPTWWVPAAAAIRRHPLAGPLHPGR